MVSVQSIVTESQAAEGGQLQWIRYVWADSVTIHTCDMNTQYKHERRIRNDRSWGRLRNIQYRNKF